MGSQLGYGYVVNWPMVVVIPQDLGLWDPFQMAQMA